MRKKMSRIFNKVEKNMRFILFPLKLNKKKESKMKKLLAGIIIIMLFGGIFGFAPGMAHADEGGAGTVNGTGPGQPPGPLGGF